jgi:hypothetical protein
MSSILAADTVSGKIYKAEDILFADKVIEARKNKDPWTVIEMLVEAWAKKTPEDFKAFKLHLSDTKSGLDDKKFGRTTGDKYMERRLTVVFPQDLMYMIRSIYKNDELPMDKKFFSEFAKRFRIFQIPEKL